MFVGLFYCVNHLQQYKHLNPQGHQHVYKADKVTKY